MKEVSMITANEFAIQLVFALADKYSISISDVFKIFTTLNYWKVINDTDVCCVLAHDGLQDTLKDIGVQFNEVLSRNR